MRSNVSAFACDGLAVIAVGLPPFGDGFGGASQGQKDRYHTRRMESGDGEGWQNAEIGISGRIARCDGLGTQVALAC